MGALVGLLAGMGLLILIAPYSPKPEGATSSRAKRKHELLVTAGLPQLSVGRVDLLGGAVALVVLLVVLVATSTVPLALAFAAFSSRLPWMVLSGRARKRAEENRLAWPEAVDHLASAVRAGLPLPEAVCALAVRGPEALREPFAYFASAYRASGSFLDSLDRLEAVLADPVADRVMEALRVAREVGGTDLGKLLRATSTFLREESRVRAEIHSRQSATVNAARLAVAAPWAVLVLLGTQSSTVQAYNSLGGFLVLAAGGAVCAIAYRVMLVLGRVAPEIRVLR